MTSLPRHWREYASEGALLGCFMIVACGVTAALEHPASTLHADVSAAQLRRLLTGVAMGLTAIALIRSPLGRRSGAHMNPSLTLAYLRLGKIAPSDAVGYVLGQFAGGLVGVVAAAAVFGMPVAHPAVRFASTAPGAYGVAAAFVAELGISFVLMTVVLVTSNVARLASWTPVFCGALVAAYITLEAPVSGMSMNPARTFASAAAAHRWTALWIYFVAPPLGMLAASELYVRLCGMGRVRCAKLDHRGTGPCIFRCDVAAAVTAEAPTHRSARTP